MVYYFLLFFTFNFFAVGAADELPKLTMEEVKKHHTNIEFVDPLAPCSTYNMFIKQTGIFINTPNLWLDADVRTSPQR